MSETVLVTGAFGFIGSAVVRQLAADGRTVIAAGRGSRANRRAARRLPTQVEVHWADLVEPGAAERLLAEAAPSAIIHLAAVIPPRTYQDVAAARRVNVEATVALVRAAEGQPHPPRFVLASSAAVYGARNPHRSEDLIGATTPVAPCEAYGLQKLEAEDCVVASSLDWVVLRLGAVLQVVPPSGSFSADSLYVGSALPIDGRTHVIDMRDATTALIAATTVEVSGEILLVAGDKSTMLRHGEIGEAIAGACGLSDCVPAGLPGDPDSDEAWYIVDWMDTTPAQQRLPLPRHSWPDMLADVRRQMGWKRIPLRLLRPFVAFGLRRQADYGRDVAGRYADPWNAIAARFGDPRAHRKEAKG
ncbi:MAG: NAD-dependent epimerase/dehydratase family protein [Mycobacterium sp.]|nr:NAD-dependent epimerase/dehydratase family protein [Mycobacterium sp.]